MRKHLFATATVMGLMKLLSMAHHATRQQRMSSFSLCLTIGAAFFTSAGFAADSPDAFSITSTANASTPMQPLNSGQDVWSRPTLLGDIGGLRPWLSQYGLNLGATEISEVLGNLHGGLKRGATYDGLTTFTLGLDTQKAFGHPGGTLNVSALQIHGRNLSQFNLGTLNTASGIEAQDSTRLWELWYQQSFSEQRGDIRIGQQSIDQEFMVSQYAAGFVNTMFGWPAVPSYDLPSGGPAYPLSALGIRTRYQVTSGVSVLAGAFDGDPLGNKSGDLSGTNFNVHNGALFIGELQYAIHQPADGRADVGTAPQHDGLPGTYKFGFWYNNERFADLHLDGGGLSLADPASDRIALTHRGNYSFYVVADQMLWRLTPEGPRSIGVFARVMGAPGDRNLVGASANAGAVMKAPFEGRENDSVALGIAYIRVGSHARLLDQDHLFFDGSPYAVRSSETAVEATYQYQVAPWCQLQEDLQYTLHAGAGQNPNDPTQSLRNTLVVGVRTIITF